MKICILPIHVGGKIASTAPETGFKPKLAFTDDQLNTVDRELADDRIIAQ